MSGVQQPNASKADKRKSIQIIAANASSQRRSIQFVNNKAAAAALAVKTIRHLFEY